MEHTMRDILSKLDSILTESIDSSINQLPSITDENIEQPIEESLFQIGDSFGISFNEDFEILSEIVDISEDGIIIDADDIALELLTAEGISFINTDLDEGWGAEKQKEDLHRSNVNIAKVLQKYQHDPELSQIANMMFQSGWKAEYIDKTLQGKGQYSIDWWKDIIAKKGAPKDWTDYMVQKYLNQPEESITYEAKYQGREVPLGKPMKGDVKKSKVYVRKPNGNIVKVNFGDKKMRIKKSNPARRKSFRARHNCKNPGPRWKARYWSCRSW